MKKELYCISLHNINKIELYPLLWNIQIKEDQFISIMIKNNSLLLENYKILHIFSAPIFLQLIPKQLPKEIILGKIYNKSVQLSSKIDLNVESSLFNKYRTL